MTVNINTMTVTEASSSAPSPSVDTPGQQPVVVSGTSPLADGFRSRFFSDADYRRFHARAPRYDAENAFFAEDFAELVAAGYLKAPLPERLGGSGLSLTELAREQRHLAYWAPATALAVNMHLYWAGSAADAAARGVADVEWLLGDVAAGKVLAAGHGERGNDVGLDDAQVRAVPQPDGSYRITGRKVFTSLSPVWDQIGVHARDDSDPNNPFIVHTFIRRDDPGVRVEETWDALGVRATASHDTVFDNAVAEAHKTVARHPVGPVYPDYIDTLLAWYLPLLSSVYFGIARRALDLAIDRGRQTFALGPFLQHGLRIAQRPARLLHPLGPVARDELRRGRITAVEKHRADHRLADVAEHGFAQSGAGTRADRAELDVVEQPQRLRDIGAAFLAHQIGQPARQLAQQCGRDQLRWTGRRAGQDLVPRSAAAHSRAAAAGGLTSSPAA